MGKYSDLPASQLVTVRGNIQLETNTAEAYFEVIAAALEEANMNLWVVSPAGGYRSHAMDIDMHHNPYKYNINPAVGLLPIDDSEHRTGRCVDWNIWTGWPKENLHRWGFIYPLAFDVNHTAHDGVTTADTNARPIKNNDEDDEDMKIVLYGTGFIVLDPSAKTARYVENAKPGTEYSLFVDNPQKLDGKRIDTLTQDGWNELLKVGYRKI